MKRIEKTFSLMISNFEKLAKPLKEINAFTTKL
jgi:hypothetical protein